MKEELESVVLQMYRNGLQCCEAVREFQKAFILTVLKDQRGNQCRIRNKAVAAGAEDLKGLDE
jgi:hypothetical protein